MKKIYLLLLLLSFSFNTVYSQSAESSRYSTSNVDPRIKEVYGDQLQTLVLNDKDRFKALNDILFVRTSFVVEKYTPSEKYVKLSEVKLFNKYNPALTRDVVFDKNTFNVLKYSFNLYSKEVQKYRVDNTDYLIVFITQSLKQ